MIQTLTEDLLQGKDYHTVIYQLTDIIAEGLYSRYSSCINNQLVVIEFPRLFAIQQCVCFPISLQLCKQMDLVCTSLTQ